MIRQRHVAQMVLAASLAIIFALLPLGSQGVKTIAPAETVEIGPDGYAVVGHFIAEEQAQVSFGFNVTAGGAIDLLLLNVTGYEGYRIGANVSGLAGSILNQSQGSGAFTDLNPGQEYYIILDNSGVPDGGASPIGSVAVSFAMSGSNITEVSTDASWLPIVLVLVFVAFIAILFLLARSKIAEREPGAKVRSLGMKYCPKCGEIVETWTHKCPRCGHEW